MGPQTMSDEFVGSDVLDGFLNKAAPNSTDSYRLTLASALLELLRLAGAEARDPQAARDACATAIAQLAQFDFSGLTFSLTRAPRSETVKDIFYQVGTPPALRDAAALEALRQFVNVLQLAPAVSNLELYNQLVAEAAVGTTTPEPPPPPKAPALVNAVCYADTHIFSPKRAPPLVQAAGLLSVFQPAKFSPDGSPQVQLFDWQSEYPDGRGLGPQLAALSLDENVKMKILAETGEFVWLSQQGFLLASATDPADYANVPPYLLACARIYAPWIWASSAEDMDPVFDARFGQFTKPVTVATYGPEFVVSLQAVFDRPDHYPPGSAVSVTLAVDGSPYSVTLDARTSKTGPYVTAKLLDANENVVMRLDTPRQFSPRGVYLFPTQEAAIVLLVF
jgi:hypothetical protein